MFPGPAAAEGWEGRTRAGLSCGVYRYPQAMVLQENALDSAGSRMPNGIEVVGCDCIE